MSSEFEYAIQTYCNGEWSVQDTYDSVDGLEHDYYLQLDQRSRTGEFLETIRMAKRRKTDWEEV